MARFRAAKRYAKGLMEFSTEQGQASQINLEMIDLVKAIESSRDLAQFLDSPILDSKKKNTIIKELFKDFSPTTQNFITLVVNHRRENGLKEIAKEFIDLYNHLNNVKKVEITSAIQLSDELIQQIVDNAKSSMGSEYTYSVETKVDADLIGGYILRVGDNQVDSSIRTRLNRLKKDFSKNDYIPKF